MRLLLPPLSLLLALGIHVSSVTAFAFTVPSALTTSGSISSSTSSSRSSRSSRAPLVPFVSTSTSTSASTSMITSSALSAKKNKGNSAKDAALAALEALEAQEAKQSSPVATAGILEFDDDDEGLSLKEKMALEKKKQKKQPKDDNDNNNNGGAANGAPANLDALLSDLDDEPLSKKEQMALEKKRQKEAKKAKADAEKAAQTEMEEIEKNKRKKALKALAEMERMEAEAGTVNDSSSDDDSAPPMSKKEAKLAAREAAKKEEKLQKKLAKKLAKKTDGDDVEDDDIMSNGANGANAVVNGDAASAAAAVNGDAEPATPTDDAPPTKKEKLTMEERIRKERPPPRIRVMESSQPDYTALRLENIAITFRDQPVLKSATWGVQTGDRIGLVGANGAGKTTQLRILAGELEPTAGDVIKSHKDLRVAMLRQEFIDEIDLECTLRQEFMSVFTEEAEIVAALRQAENELENMSGEDSDAMQEVLDRMAKLQAKADSKNVGALDSRVSKIMDLMGFDPEEGEYKVSMFSGGWKMRIGLGKVLLKDPNILLLDEPTNHLDLESVEWLEAFLRNQNLPMVIVSHDREFLDQVCTKIVDAEGGICTEYQGNYSKFLQLKKARMDAWHAAYNSQEKKIKEERQWINKFRLKQPQAVKQREAQLEKLIKSPDYVQKPPFEGKPFRFRFPPAPRLSPEVAEVKGLTHGYGNGANRLFEDCDLFIEKGDRIAVIGPNGAGKSTLLRILMGKEEPDEGTAEFIGSNVYPAYFEQNQADVLDLDKTVLDTIQAASHGQSYNELRALLGQFLFKGDAVEKKVESLSGGEKARLSLCCMMLRESNLLILDEPTNHLDIPAKEMLEEALQHFEGSVVVISHDRYFISKVATTIVAIEDKKLVKYGGDYKFYMDKSKTFKEKVEARYVNGLERIGNAPVIDLEEIQANAKKKNFGGAKTANMVSRKDKGIKNAKRNKVM
eukprot:CAMPEP_0171337532 /NCGR_PEP_ID=MMETSP0878-20121228/6736_1 /TAXON_ID=67004 /ORGANISM="Thalassiosira weissflogii, Strain CCMP1336" /LENGTH=961 /DNA_ID=CAMNT_0011839157 /DNA_START=149 /DNA_END=3034 /DNA_ORIENTATION=+